MNTQEVKSWTKARHRAAKELAENRDAKVTPCLRRNLAAIENLLSGYGRETQRQAEESRQGALVREGEGEFQDLGR
jgi:hypothetical protein